MIDNICNFFIKNSPQFINLFKVGYIILILVVGTVVSTNRHMLVSSLFGEVAVLIYLLTLVPGMALRLGITHPAINVVRVYRRHLGISMYLFAFSHMFTKRYPDLAVDFATVPSFELMGTISLFIFMVLFITSNNQSQKLLGKGWISLQKLTYLGMFFVFLHLSLLDIGKWTILMGVTILIQLYSFVVASKSPQN